MSSSQSQSGSFALVLGEKEGSRRLPIIIGMFEAQSIAIQIEKINPTRPLTHDLFKSFAQQMNVRVQEIMISDLKEGVFFSKIVCTDGEKEFELDARPSDAIAIGLRFGVPIYTVESVLSEAGIILSDMEDEDEETGEIPTSSSSASSSVPATTGKSNISDVSTEELNTMLNDALEKEDYERAAKIRDELNKRS
nr:bifunctional nuclease family protein [Sabulibacter ruber]